MTIYGKREEIPIYENPGSSDYTQMKKDARRNNTSCESVRFMADAKSKKLYVWDAGLALHGDASYILRLNWNAPWVLVGYGIIKGSSIGSGTTDYYRELSLYRKYDWSFLKKYFSDDCYTDLMLDLGLK